MGIPQPRRSASRNRAAESALGEEDSSVSFNGAELTAELSPMLRPKASLIGRILCSLPRCTPKIPARTNTANFPGKLTPKSRPTWGNQTQGTFLPPLAKISKKFTCQRWTSVSLRRRSRQLVGDVLSRPRFTELTESRRYLSRPSQNLISRFVQG